MDRLETYTRLAGLTALLTSIVLAEAYARAPGGGGPSAPAAVLSQEGKPRVNPNAKAIAEFQEEVDEYVELHRRVARSVPPLSAQATPEMIDAHQRALGRAIQQARKNATVGDIFEREVRPVLRRLLHGLFAGVEGQTLRMSVMEENPGETVKLVINGRYPDTFPLSSVPPQILKALPPLPLELEYRFIQSSLILLDVDAHIIVDYLTGAVPR
jgi:hypothetical protein